MSMLNFKHGLFENLFNTDGSNKVAISNGTIYVTTDEKAMYVDLNDTRIRLNQIITLSTYDWQHLPPPYSTEAFYYLSDSNALLKYNSKGEWVQINSTSELSTALANLTTRVGTAETTISNNTTAINALNGVVTDPTTGLAATKTIADAAKTTAEAALPKTQFETWRDGTLATDIANAKKAGDDAQSALNAHAALKTNPHEVTAEQVGLGNVNNTSDMDKPVSTAQATAIAEAKNAVLGTADDTSAKNTVYGAKKAAAEALQSASDVNTALNAYTASNNAVIATIKGTDENFDSFDDVKAELTKTYATKTYAEAQANAVLGNNNDDATAQTVKGAHAAAAAAMEKATQAANAAATNLTSINAEVARVDAILKDANASMVTFKQVYEAIEAVKDDVNDLGDTYATDDELKAAKEAILGAGHTGTVKEAAVAAATAQSGVNANAAAIEGIKNGTNINNFAGVETAIANVQDQIDDLDNTYATNDELNAAKTAILGEANYGQTVKSAYTLADTANQATIANAAAIETITKDATIKTFAGIEGEISGIKTQISKLDETYATDAQVESAVSTAKSQLTTTINGVSTEVGKNTTAINANTAAIEALAARVTTEIQTADALVYVGTISVASGLPTTEVKVGHTYKVTTDILKSEFTNVNFDASTSEDAMIHTGDLLIATGTETDGIITSNLAWDHIPSGYHADYVPELAADFEVRNGVTSAIVNLTSAHAADNVTGDLGKFTVAQADGSAITIAKGVNNEITIGMTWGTF